MKKVIGILMLSLAFFSTISTAKAQPEKEENNENVTITAYLSGGTQYINVGRMNDALNSINFSSFSNFNYLTGIGADVAIFNRWIIGGEWDHCKNMSSSYNGNLKLAGEMVGSRTMIRFGYNVIHKENFNLFPEIGFGGNLIHFNTYNVSLDSTELNFTEVFQTTDCNTITYSNSFINIGIGVDFTIKDGENAKGGCRIGLRGGYMAGLSKSWRNNIQNINGPNIAQNMFYVKLTVGFSKM